MALSLKPALTSDSDVRVRLWLLPGFLHLLRAATAFTSWLMHAGRRESL